jgi:hypothetical protein
MVTSTHCRKLFQISGRSLSLRSCTEVRKGDLEVLDSYRGVHESAYKKLTKLINGRNPDDQFGFRIGRSRLQTTSKLLNNTEESLRMMDERLLTVSWATPRHSIC